MRGRNRSKGPNPLTRSYESNGPDVKIRGTAQHIADKYAQLARDAQASGDPVAAENYLQHAEHYYRIIAAAQEQFRDQFGSSYQRPFDDDGDEDAGAGMNGHNYGGSKGATTAIRPCSRSLTKDAERTVIAASVRSGSTAATGSIVASGRTASGSATGRIAASGKSAATDKSAATGRFGNAFRAATARTSSAPICSGRTAHGRTIHGRTASARSASRGASAGPKPATSRVAGCRPS